MSGVLKVRASSLYSVLAYYYTPLQDHCNCRSVPSFFPLRRRGGACDASAAPGDGRMADGLLEAVRGLHLAHPELGPKPLLAKLRGSRRCRRGW